jgi:2'-5' RNA ligase
MSRYFIALIPQESLNEKIMAIKREVAEKYGSRGALRSPAHITLHMPFDLVGTKEKKFLEAFSAYAPAIPAFKTQLENFDCFAPRVIFISVKPCETLNELQKNVVEFMKRRFSIFNQSDSRRPFHPHVTVAFRDLKKNSFETAWQDFKNRSFNETLFCDAVSLLVLDEKGWREKIRVSL